MDTHILLKMDNSIATNNHSVLETLKTYSEASFATHSDLAIETFNIILGVGNFLLAILNSPYIVKLIDSKEMIVSFDGFNVSGSWKEIIKSICNDPYAKEMFIKSYYQHAVSVKGKNSDATNFHREIRALLGIQLDDIDSNGDYHE